jgi:hypothetical protein
LASTLRKIALDLLHGKLPPTASKELAEERLKLCEGCENFKPLARQCNLCGCFMDVKSKLLEAQCPIELW